MQYKFLQGRGALNEADNLGHAARTGTPPTPGRFPGDALLRSPIPPQVVQLIPESVARENVVMPVSADGDRVLLASYRADDVALADKLSFILNRSVKLVPASREAVVEAINKYYGATETASVDSMLAEFTDTAVDFDLAEGEAAPAWRRLKKGMVHAPAAAAGGLRHAMNLAAAAGEQHHQSGLDVTTRAGGGGGMFYHVVPEGERILKVKPDGSMEIVIGPKKVWRGRNKFQAMRHFVAHPGQFLIVRYRDGRQEHFPGPAEVWQDPRAHRNITCEEGLQLGGKEAVIVYSQPDDSSATQRRVVYGPTLFIPRPGEWLHTFSWHASVGGHKGVQKVPNALVFQKLWLMPDQMYHDVLDVRTADDALLTIRLMIFFELVDIERMLDTTHDPIGDFVNAASSDVVEFVGRYSFEEFKHNTARLNDLEAYGQLLTRAQQSGYRIGKVVYRGYGAADALQKMHDDAIQARTRLQLDRATEQQSQDLENYKLDAQIARAAKRRVEQAGEVAHELDLARRRQEAELERQQAGAAATREQRRQEADVQAEIRRRTNALQQEHLTALRDLGVGLTEYLTQARADRVIEVRGAAGTHVHMEPGDGNGKKRE